MWSGSTRPRTAPAPARCSTATASATWSSARSSGRPTATPASPSGTRSAAACSTATARPSGSCGELRDAAARVEVLRKPARRVPRRAADEPPPPSAERLLGVVAHPPDAEREALAVVVPERVGEPRATALGDDQDVGVRRPVDLREVEIADVEAAEVPGVGERRAVGGVDGDRQLRVLVRHGQPPVDDALVLLGGLR